MTSDKVSISEWFHGRSVFVTGGTGFMGKVLIYKLLLSCHDLGNVFVLVRKKREVDPLNRLRLMIEQEPFKTFNEKYPERLKKIILIPGDITSEDLALSTVDKARLLQEVSVVFHMAANVKFDVPLKESVTINTLGTMNMLNFAKQMPNLKCFIHVSTAYCHCTEPVLEERSYPSTVKPETVIESVNNMSDDVLNAMTPSILQGLPNTYTFSKALSEDLIRRCDLPIGVARPSIVVASWKEPKPGWVENMNGPTGLMVGAGKGVIRSMLCNGGYALNVIPCDMAINAIIALAWKVGREQPKEPMFMNVTNASENPLKWGYAVDTGRKYMRLYPFTGILWYPGGTLTTVKSYHWIRVILLHYIPAYFLDAIIALTGNKPFLVKVQHKVNAGIDLIKYYTTQQWDFRNNQMRALQRELNPSDKEEFFMDTKVICWDDYMLQYILGTRQYCLKDDLSTLPRARKVIRYMYFADWFVKISLTILFVWFVYSWISPYREITMTAFETNEI